MTILENLRLAHTVISGIPEAAVNLSSYRSDCGTLACTAGHLCEHPHFATFMGLSPMGYAGHTLRLRGTDGDFELESAFNFKGFEAHFGPGGYARLFPERDGGQFDYEHPDNVYFEEESCHFVADTVSDKALALWRIERQIEAVSK